MIQSSEYADLARKAREYIEDYEFVLQELRSGRYNLYVIVPIKNGNMDALYQAEKDFEYERRVKESKENKS